MLRYTALFLGYAAVFWIPIFAVIFLGAASGAQLGRIIMRYAAEIGTTGGGVLIAGVVLAWAYFKEFRDVPSAKFVLGLTALALAPAIALCVLGSSLSIWFLGLGAYVSGVSPIDSLPVPKLVLYDNINLIKYGAITAFSVFIFFLQCFARRRRERKEGRA